MSLSKEIAKVNYLYSNPDWMDIPAFFKYVRTLKRGDIYRLLGIAIKAIDDNWSITYYRNSNKNYNNFIKYLYSIGFNKQVIRALEDVRDKNDSGKFKSGCSQHRLPRAQALDDIISFPSNVNSAVLGINTVIPLLASAATGISNVTGSITTMFNFITDVVTQWKTSITNMATTISNNLFSLMEYIVKLLALAYLLSQKHNQSVSNALALLTLILPVNVTTGILPFAEGLIRVIKGMMGMRAQAEDDDCGFIKSFYHLTLGITKGLFGEVPKDVFDSLNISGRKVKLIADYIKGASTIFDCLSRLFYKTVEIIGDNIFKYFGYAPTFMKEEGLTTMIDEFLQIKIDRLDQQCTIHVDAARKVVNLYERLLQYESKINRCIRAGTAGNLKQAPYLRVMIKTLESSINRIPDHLRTGLTPRRTKPFWVYLYGDPRIGKTAVLQPHLVNALSRALKLINKYEDYTNYTYLRNCGEDYWEGYDNHPILWYNDLFQNYAQDEKMHQAIMELTNIVDDNVYPLEMAFERKHCVYFSSEVVISNAQHDIINAGFIQNKCWSGGQHLFARRNICLKLTLNPRYAAAIGINYPVMKMSMMANPQLCVGYENCTLHTQEEYDEKLLFPNDMYVMDFTDPVNGNLIQSMDYPSGIQYICQQAIDYKRTQGAFKEKLYNHFENMWAQADDDTVETFEDARLATQSELTEAILQEAFRAIQTAMPEFTGSDYVYSRRNARMDDGVFQYYATWLSDNRDEVDDRQLRANARIRVAIELVGAEHYTNQNVSYWKKFCRCAKNWVANTWLNFKSFVQGVMVTLGPYTPIVEFAINWFCYYKAFQMYVNFCVRLFAPPVVYIEKKEEEVLIDGNIDSKAQSHEAKLKPAVPQILRVPKKTGVTAQSYDQQNTIIENIINKQMCKFTIRVFKDSVEVHNRRFGSGLCLGSDIFVVPYHFWYRWQEMREYWKEHECEVKLCLNWNEVLEVILDWNAMTLCKLNYSHTEDLAYFRIKNLVQRPHLRKFFISSNDRPMLNTLYIYGKRANSFDITTMGVTDGEYKLTTYLHESRDDPLYGGKFAKREICIPIALHYYNCCTSAGDCGTMVLHCDSSLNCKKIMAMHTAGHVAEGYGIGSLIFQEDIEEVFSFFYPDGFNIAPVAMEYDDVEDTLKLGELGLQVLGKLPRLVVPEFNIDKSPVLMMPRKSRISKSVVYDIMEEDYGPSTVKPAHLRPYMVNEIRMSPLYSALKKMAVVSPMPDELVTEQIVQHMFETIASWRSTTRPRVFTDDEMVNGCGLMNAVEMSTSAGYPYVVINNTSGKHPFFEATSTLPIKYTPGPYLQDRLDERESDASKGIITQTYFVDTLKDETRPIEKVDSGKTRLFQIAPLDFNLLLRKYFGAFLCHCQEVFIVGEGAVGVNANSYEWTLMMRDILEIGTSLINGDGKNFDASASQPIAMHNVEAINRWYQLGRDWHIEHDRIRRVLWATFLNSNHIVRNLIYRAQQGNKSGTAVTTWFNNLMGMFGIRWTYILCGYQLHSFHKAVKPKFYGDDDLIGVNEILAPKVTCLKHKETMALMGIEYTSATKGEVVDTWYKLTEVSFLKRKFVWDGLRYLPQLDHTVIYEIARWSESDPTNMTDQMNRFNSSLLEVSNYGRSEFNLLRNNYVNYSLLIRRRGMVIDPTQLFGYDYCEYIKWGDLYKPAQLSIDRARFCDEEHVVQYESAANDVKLSTSEDTFDLNSSENNQIANAQTHEGKNMPPKAQTIRISRPKAQGEETEVKDFELYLTMMDYLKEMEPCFKNFERAMSRSMRQPVAKWTVSQLHTKVKSLITIYKECTAILCPLPVAQSEEGHVDKIPTMIFENSKNEKPVQSDIATPNVVKSDTTYIVNSETPHQPPVQHSAVPKADNSNLYNDMELYFRRPVLMDQFQWKTTDTIWSTVGTWDFPKDYITLPGIAEKLAMVMYARPDFEFEIFVNATKFHYGRLVFCVIPFYQDSTTKIPDAYDKAYNAFTWPHWYQVSAGTGQSVKFTVPYRHIMSQIQLNSTASHNRRMFSIRGYVSVPLQSANSDSGTSAPVEVSIMTKMINPRLFGNVWTGAITQGEEVNLTRQQITSINPIGGGNVKVVSAALEGVSKITKDMSQLAYAAGFSTPPNLGSTSSMQIRQPLMNKISDLPNTVVLGPDMQCQLANRKEFVNSESEDDMNINQIISHPSLLSTVKLSASDGVGKLLFTSSLRPASMYFRGEGYTAPTGAYYPHPVAYLAKYFNMWRGGFKLHFAAVASGFHSARLRIFYIPSGMDSTMGLPSENLAGLRQTSMLRNVIWDIAKTTEITLRFPYESNTHWRHSDTTLGNSLGGMVGIQVLNTMTAATPSATPTPVYIQIFACADDDFQFALPGTLAVTGGTWAPDFATTLTTAQGEEMEACSLPSSSATCIREQVGILMGDIDSRHRKYGDAVGGTFTSVKQLINQLTPIDYFSSATADTNNITGRKYSPYGTISTKAYTDSFWYAPLHTITPLFRFVRGSFRVHVLANDKIQTGAIMNFSSTDIDMYSTDNRDLMNGLTTESYGLRYATMGYAHFYDNTIYPVDVTVPYYHTHPCLLTSNGKPNTTGVKMVPSVSIGMSTQKSAKNMIFCVAGGDDYMLGYRMSIPRVRTAAATVTSEVARPTRSIQTPTTLGPNEHMTMTKDGLKIRRTKRSFIDRLMNAPDTTKTESSDEDDTE